MKVKNLYIGQIRILTDIDIKIHNIFEFETIYMAKRLRSSVLYRINDNGDEVKDILYGGVYNIGCPFDGKIGDEFADKLDFVPIYTILHYSGYGKKNISKRKLLKLIYEFKKNEY